MFSWGESISWTAKARKEALSTLSAVWACLCYPRGWNARENKRKVFVNRIEYPFTRWVELHAGEVLFEDEKIVLDDVKTTKDTSFVITSLQVGVRRVTSALDEELDTIWARPLNEIAFAKRRKVRQKHPVLSENIKTVVGIYTPSDGVQVMQDNWFAELLI